MFNPSNQPASYANISRSPLQNSSFNTGKPQRNSSGSGSRAIGKNSLKLSSNQQFLNFQNGAASNISKLKTNGPDYQLKTPYANQILQEQNIPSGPDYYQHAATNSLSKTGYPDSYGGFRGQKEVYYDQNDKSDNPLSTGYIQKSSSIATRQVIGIQNRNARVSYNQFQHNQHHQKSMNQKRKEADEVTKMMEEELLNKFRPKIKDLQKPNQLSSSNTGTSTLTSQKQKLIENDANTRLRQNLLNQAKKEFRTIDLRGSSSPKKDQDELNLNSESSNSVEFDFDVNKEELIFKNQLTKAVNKSPFSDISAEDRKGKIEIQEIKENSSSIVEINEADIDITSDHLKSDGSSPSKLQTNSLFKQRTLCYGDTDVKQIKNSFYSKYFDTNQGETARIKSMARANSFLLQKNQKTMPLTSRLRSDLEVHHHLSSVTENYEMNKALMLDKNLDLKDCEKMIKRKNWKLLRDNELKKQEEIEKLKKLKLLQRKKKIIEKKKEHDKVLNELFNYDFADNDKNGNPNKKSQGGLKGLLEGESSQSDEKPTDEDMEIDLEEDKEEQEVQIDSNNQYELMRRRILLEQQKEFEEKMRLVRFKNRWNVDELIQPILNLEIIDMYLEDNRDPNMFPELPEKFQSSGQYFDLWHKLFLYETYNQLINQRNESEKDKQIAKMFGFKLKNDNTNKNFKGLLQKYKSDSKFIQLKLSENDNNNGKTSSEVTGNFNTPYPNLDSLKEFDLLLLSTEQLDTKNVKQLTSTKFLKDIQTKQGTMMAIVDGKRKFDKNYIYIRVDISHDKYINLTCSEYDYHQMYVYYFDSMSTRIREYRTVKSVEFYPNTYYILDPSLIPKRSLSIQDQTSDESGVSAKKGPLSINSSSKLMNTFVDKHSHKFNDSQKKALQDVSNMNDIDFLLIQGPPGTGKTHTIKGIISMLNYAVKNNRKILVCAPSNAAIDEIVTRLISKGGLFGQSEAESIKKVLRIGAMDYEPSKTVQQVMMGTKIKQGASQIDTVIEKEMLDAQRSRWVIDIDNVEKLIKQIAQARGIAHQTSLNIKGLAEKILADINQITIFMKYDKDKKIKKLKAYQSTVRTNLRMQEEQKRPNGHNMTRTQRIALEKKIVENTQIICTTLAMSTNEKLDHLQAGDIDYLIVDEACQSVELNNLIPFEHQPRKVILVGDQQQLPATTFSENAEKTKYSRSMFERFLECGAERVMLEIQYRMHPKIREFPSNQFYQQRLKDAKSIALRTESSSFKECNVSLIQDDFQPIKFFDLAYSVEECSETSKINNDEVDFIEQFLKQFILKVTSKIQSKPVNIFAKNFPKKELTAEQHKQNRKSAMEELKGLIGIISPYKSQVRQLKDKVFRLLRQYCDIYAPQDYVEINTVDAFQGREKDIIIFSCVRSSKERQLGFVSDYRRMNVAITRARHCLYVVGNSNTLTRDVNWRSFIKYCRDQGNQNYVEYKTKDSFKIRTPNNSKDTPLTSFTEAIYKIKSTTEYKPKEKEFSPQKQLEVRSKNEISYENLGLAGLAQLEAQEYSNKERYSPQNDKISPKSTSNQTELVKSEVNKNEKQRACSADPYHSQCSQISKKQQQEQKSDIKSAKGDMQIKKSQDKSQSSNVKHESNQPSVSNKSSSYQSYKPNMVYTRCRDATKTEQGNTASTNKQTQSAQVHNSSSSRQYGRSDRDNNGNTSRFQPENTYRNQKKSDQILRDSNNYHKRPGDRERKDFQKGGYKHTDNYRKENRTNNLNSNRREGIANSEMQHKPYHNQHNRSMSKERPFYKKREVKEQFKGSNPNNNQFNNNKRARY